jgi:peptidyl-prolyl cis-trans isomerase B (cyclophilin B)
VAGKQERQRRLARERHARRQAREAQRQANQRKMAKIIASGAAIVVIAAVVVVGVLELSKSPKSSAAKSPSTPSASATTTPSATPTPTPSSSPVTEPAKHCTYIPNPPAARKVGFPPAKPDYKATYQATINTNRGAIVIDLLNSKATCTVNSFVFLADKGFYNNTPCPRLVTSGIYVLQCGDPTGTGSGGPGYEYASENLTNAKYPAATVAMANTGAPNTNGSQFFLVYKNTPLPPSYTPFGKIVSGLSVLQDLAKAGVKPPLNPAGGGHPKDKVTIESVTINKT